MPAAHVGSSHRFAPGTVIADRYEIVCVAGAGGMGVVYEALDRELGERIALKTLIAGDESDRGIAQLRREVQLARRVTHPNVCRIFDVGKHDTNGVTTLFVTMEYLDGMTLSEYIRRHGRVQEAIAAEILRQICGGIDAAHEAGIIHQDFKSANVMIVRRTSESGIRAVITDFGLARTVRAAADDGSNISEHVAGTPAFMAPEQVEGKHVGRAADIYAVGVVAFEMITGALPFDGSLHSLVRRIHEPAPSPRAIVPDIDDRWEHVILRCLERDPRLRYLFVQDVARDLQHGDVALPRGRRIVRWLTATALVVMIVGTVVVVVQQTLAPDDVAVALLPGLTGPRPAVAVIGFRNAAGRPDAAWLATAFAEMISTELGAAESLRLVPGEEVASARRDLALTDAVGHSAATLARLRDRLHAEYVVGGSYVATAAGELRLDIRVQDARTAETVAALSQAGVTNDLFSLVSRAGEELRNRLGTGGGVRRANIRAAVPSSSQAARLYAEGVARLREWDAKAAVALLQRAVDADPRFALAHAELSEGWMLLGDDARALKHAKRAFELSSSLPRGEKMLVEATFRQRAGELDAAVALLRRLTQLFPDDPEIRIRLFNVLVDSSRGSDARAAISEFTIAHPAIEDPRIPLVDASAAETISDHEAMLASADRALAIARKQKNRFVAAEALVIRSTALAIFSKYDEASDAVDAAEGIFVDIGHRAGVAKAYRKHALIEFRQGNFDEAKRLSERAIAVYEELGQQHGLAAATGGLGVIMNQLGRHGEARTLFGRALAIYRRIGDRQNSAWAMSSIAGTYVMQHQLDAGIARYEEALVLSRQLGDLSEVATTLANLGIAIADKGDLGAAEKRLVEAGSLFVKIGDRSMAAHVDAQLGSIAFKRGNLAMARQYHEQAFALRQALGERAAVAASQRALAAVALEEDNPAGALAFAMAAASAFQLSEQPSEEAQCLIVVARAHRSLGHHADAAAAIDAAEKLAPKVEDPEVALGIELVRADLDAHNAREREDAVGRMRDIVARAARQRMVDVGLEARLALGEVLLRSGDRREGRAVLERLASDAKRLQYGRIAARAETLAE